MQSSGKHTQRCKTHKKPKRTASEDRQAMWSRWGGRVDHKIHMESCISHQSSSRSSSGTWTEPPSRSAVRCDPRVSLLVTGVGWDSLPLGSGDLTQRANKGVGGRWAGSDENRERRGWRMQVRWRVRGEFGEGKSGRGNKEEGGVNKKKRNKKL